MKRTLLLGLLLALPACPRSGGGPATTPAPGTSTGPAATATDAAPPVAPAGAQAGTTKEAAINVCGPAGERAYLARLRCPEGVAPKFERAGSVGPRFPGGDESPEALEARMDMDRTLEPGEIDHHTIDLYQVDCADGPHEVYLDMYHCADPPPTSAPPGFRLE